MTKRPEEVIEELRSIKRQKRQLEDEEIGLAMEVAKEKMFYKLNFDRTASPSHRAVETRYYTREALAVEVGQYLSYEHSKYIPRISPVDPSDLRMLAEEDVVLDDMSQFKTRTILSIYRQNFFETYFLLPEGVDSGGLLVVVGGLLEAGSNIRFSIEGGYVCSDNAVGSMEDILTRIKNIVK